MKRIIAGLTIVGLLAAFGVNVSVASKDKDKEKAKKESSAEVEEYMKAHMEAIAPNEHHKALESRAGDWNAQVTIWNAPGMEPQVSEGKAQLKMVLGGRYLVEHFESEMMGMAFEGIGMVGYDKVAHKHSLMWCDNMGTSMTFSEGECADNCKTVIHNTTIRVPMMGEMKVKMVTKVIDENQHVFEYYMPGPDGAHFKSMEIVYTRG